MLKTLIKKQFKECFKGYFVDSKTGKAKSKRAIIGMFVLFASIMIFLAFSFFMMSMSVSSILQTDVAWLYYAIFAIVSIALGTFASVFNTANSLYNAKDNDLLLSMPIKPSYVLISRICLIYGLSFIYTATAWIPICLTPIIFHGYSPLILIPDLLLLILIVLFVTVLTCGFGYIIAKITNKTKNKSIITVLLSLIFLGVYYFVCFRFEVLLNSLLDNSNKVAGIVSTWLNLIYQLAKAANGDILGFIIFSLITVVLSFGCFVILEKSFYKIIINSNKVSSTKSKIKYNSHNSVYKTLLSKEFKRFINSPTYLLNMGLGCLLAISAAVAMFVKRNEIPNLLLLLNEMIPGSENYIPLFIVMIVCLLVATCGVTVPSISLEGKNLWILKSLPIDTINILTAKRNVQFIFVGVPSTIAGIIFCYTFKLDILLSLDVCTCILCVIGVDSYIASFLSLINPNFSWTNETQPIKQTLNILIYMVVAAILSILIVVIYYLLRNVISVNEYLEYAIIALFIMFYLLGRIHNKWAISRFELL